MTTLWISLIVAVLVVPLIGFCLTRVFCNLRTRHNNDVTDLYKDADTVTAFLTLLVSILAVFKARYPYDPDVWSIAAPVIVPPLLVAVGVPCVFCISWLAGIVTRMLGRAIDRMTLKRTD